MVGENDENSFLMSRKAVEFFRGFEKLFGEVLSVCLYF
jgi:hypothetical protein